MLRNISCLGFVSPHWFGRSVVRERVNTWRQYSLWQMAGQWCCCCTPVCLSVLSECVDLHTVQASVRVRWKPPPFSSLSPPDPLPLLQVHCSACLSVPIGYLLHKLQTAVASCKWWPEAGDVAGSAKANVLFFQWKWSSSCSASRPQKAHHVPPHLAPPQDLGQPRASRPTDVSPCRLLQLQEPQQEGDVWLSTQIWPLRPERRSGSDGQSVRVRWTCRWGCLPWQTQQSINGLKVLVVICLLNWTSSSPSVGRSLLLPPSRSDRGSQLGAPRWRLWTDGEQHRRLRSFHAVYRLHARCQCARFIMPIAIQHRGGEKPVNYPSKIDADIDSLTNMLADLDSHTQDSGAQVMKERFIYLPLISQSRGVKLKLNLGRGQSLGQHCTSSRCNVMFLLIQQVLLQLADGTSKT